jgi:hypothetical protein
MRFLFEMLVIAVCFIAASGCTQPVADLPKASKETLADEKDRAGANADSSQPRFESELTYHYQTQDGVTIPSTHRSSSYRDGKAFRFILHHASTFPSSEKDLPLRVEIKFLTHREGKDVYRVKYTRPLEGGSKTTTHELEYIGQSIVVVEDESVKCILQPPTDEVISHKS